MKNNEKSDHTHPMNHPIPGDNAPTGAASTNPTRFDVRRIPCRVKHAQIFQRWADLPVGGHFVLVNDHDPVPLYYQFAAQFPGAFSWEYLATEADEFHVKITRLAASPAVPPVAPPPRPGAPVCRHDRAGEAETATVDARGLEPPEPMMRILEGVESLAPGAELVAFTDRQPLHLYPELDTRGVAHASEQQPDGSWRTTLRRS
ncbi:hemerythrin [Opitutaceae bacterium TAV5]|nr:hemerythrin [Opitutaceae bacterium TAV5]